jgi:hypothetical protein
MNENTKKDDHMKITKDEAETEKELIYLINLRMRLAISAMK